MTDKFINIQVLYSLLELEPFILIAALIAITWIFYKSFLPEVSEERHRNLRVHFRTIIRHFFVLSTLFALFIFSQTTEGSIPSIQRITPYFGLLTFFWGNFVFVKTCRLLILQYLFLGSMKHGVPLLLVNMFTLILSILLLFWGITRIFEVNLAPLMATSAAFSIILGLAMQDTLGNLFAGISLQIDRTYEIGDWLEVQSGMQKCVGQVKEISWRATTLVGLSDEVVTLPNRFMAQAQVSNYSPPEQPIMRTQIFRIEYGQNMDLAREALEKMAAGISEIRGIPAPYTYVSDTTESWITIKILYFIDSYGSQWRVGGKVLKRGTDALQEKGIKFARQVMEVELKNIDQRSHIPETSV
jgi:small-conductance mechanosensitive channel